MKNELVESPSFAFFSGIENHFDNRKETLAPWPRELTISYLAVECRAVALERAGEQQLLAKDNKGPRALFFFSSD